VVVVELVLELLVVVL